MTKFPFRTPGKIVFVLSDISLTPPRELGYCQYLVVNEYFESRARKLAKRRFFQTFVLETIEPLGCKQLKFPGNFNCLQHSGHERKVIQYHCLPKIKHEVSYAGMTKKNLHFPRINIILLH